MRLDQRKRCVRSSARRAPEAQAIANAGISGNRVLNRAMARRRWSGWSATSSTGRVRRTSCSSKLPTTSPKFPCGQIIAGTQQIIDKVHAKGLKIIGVTVIPRGRPAPAPGWTSAQEAQRIALNEWVRTKAGFDAVIDFDALMKNGPTVTLADGGSAPAIPAPWNCDNIHPNAAGYRAMGEFVDPGLFDGPR